MQTFYRKNCIIDINAVIYLPLELFERCWTLVTKPKPALFLSICTSNLLFVLIKFTMPMIFHIIVSSICEVSQAFSTVTTSSHTGHTVTTTRWPHGSPSLWVPTPNGPMGPRPYGSPLPMGPRPYGSHSQWPPWVPVPMGPHSQWVPTPMAPWVPVPMGPHPNGPTGPRRLVWEPLYYDSNDYKDLCNSLSS